MFQWAGTSKKHFPWIPLNYISGVEEKNDSVSRVEARSNTSTVALRVVGGVEKGTQCLGV
jgi:hypothetical protein